ncbi:hypothetical protein NM688_g1202 [Phlebia brevispora]|uniref:Uncharacterized protein n=1 Tax=Phlebia brevispora TaxID=194682 RepID=A0ACC1TCX1_9APHY|nr:hypothetical protein NM688_g1202 [Phlebia brevispora]
MSLPICPRLFLIVRHLAPGPPVTAKANIHMRALFSPLPRDIHVVNDNLSLNHPDSMLLLLECLCEDCISALQTYSELDPRCSWYQLYRKANEPLMLMLHDFSCPPSSFSDLGISADELLIESSGDAQRAQPSFIRPVDAAYKLFGHPGGNLRWTRVSFPRVPQTLIMSLETHKAVAGADIPVELFDLMLRFLSVGLCGGASSLGFDDHRCKNREECSRNYVDCTRHELIQIARVCRRWSHLVGPILSRRVVLRGPKDLTGILAIRHYPQFHNDGQYLVGDLDIIEQLHAPWIHNIPLRLFPKLRVSAENTALKMRNTGPFPRNQIISSIHGSLRKTLPRFSSGVREVSFSEVQFRSFTHLLRLIKELPSLRSLRCVRVTWDTWSPQPGRLPLPTSFLARDDPTEGVAYVMEDCTDDRAMYLLQILLGQTRQDILDQRTADVLCTLVFANVISGECKHKENEIIIGTIQVQLTPRAGIQQRRRAQCIVLDMQKRHWSGYDWPKIDEQLARLSALQAVLLVFHSRDILLQCLYIALPFTIHLYTSQNRLILVYPTQGGWNQVTLSADGSIEDNAVNLLDPDQSWKHVLRECPHLSRPPQDEIQPRGLRLNDVHFKSFEHLLRLVKVLPSLEDLRCKRVTWETLGASADRIPSPMSFLTRDNLPQQVYYNMSNCTNNRASIWLGLLLGLAEEDVLDRRDIDALWAIASAWEQNGDGYSSQRSRDEIKMGMLRVQLTPTPGGPRPRRVEHIVFDSWTFSTEFNWSELDKQVGNLSALQTVLLIAASRDCLLKYCDNVPPLIPRLRSSRKLKLSFKSKGSHQKRKKDDEYVQISLTDNEIQSIGVPATGRRPVSSVEVGSRAVCCEWAQLEAWVIIFVAEHALTVGGEI